MSASNIALVYRKRKRNYLIGSFVSLSMTILRISGFGDLRSRDLFDLRMGCVRGNLLHRCIKDGRLNNLFGDCKRGLGDCMNNFVRGNTANNGITENFC